MYSIGPEIIYQKVITPFSSQGAISINFPHENRRISELGAIITTFFSIDIALLVIKVFSMRSVDWRNLVQSAILRTMFSYQSQRTGVMAKSTLPSPSQASSRHSPASSS
jgi:hypothetical protein